MAYTEADTGCTLVSVVLTPGDEVPPQLGSGHLVMLADIPEVTQQQQPHEEGEHRTLTRIVEQKTTTGSGSLHQTFIQLPSPRLQLERGVKESNMDGSSCVVEMRDGGRGSSKDFKTQSSVTSNHGNKKKRPTTLATSPSDPGLCSQGVDKLSARNLHQKTKSLGYLGNGLTDSEKLLALQNFQRRSTQPEVFIFPGGVPDTIPENEIEGYSQISSQTELTGHVNTGFRNDHFDNNGYHDIGHKKGSVDPDNNNVHHLETSDDEVFLAHKQNHLKYTSSGDLVRIDYENIFGDKEKKSAKTQNDKPRKPERSMSIGERALRKVVRQVSRRRQGYRVERLQQDGPRPPKNYFDLALFSCCCCVSPLGLIAVILSVKTDVAFKDGHPRRAQRLSHASLILSILGIGLTLLLTILVLVTRFYYWDDVYQDKHLGG